MAGRLHHVVVDCKEPAVLAAFYSRLLGLPVTCRSEDWVVVAANETTSGVAFQLAPDHQAPSWGDPDRPQQIHLDVMVDDLEAVAADALAMGARALTDAHDGSQVFADPAGHTFCLIPRPSWSPPLDDTPR
jgi:catechol 2,3-dioxygenase-like lactoylglutathione lyase family enzyme